MQPEELGPGVVITEADLRDFWRSGDLKTVSYLALILKILGANQQSVEIDAPGDQSITPVKRFCKHWEIPERTFYRAKSDLIARGKLQEKITGKILVVVKDADV